MERQCPLHGKSGPINVKVTRHLNSPRVSSASQTTKVQDSPAKPRNISYRASLSFQNHFAKVVRVDHSLRQFIRWARKLSSPCSLRLLKTPVNKIHNYPHRGRKAFHIRHVPTFTRVGHLQFLRKIKSSSVKIRETARQSIHILHLLRWILWFSFFCHASTGSKLARSSPGPTSPASAHPSHRQQCWHLSWQLAVLLSSVSSVKLSPSVPPTKPQDNLTSCGTSWSSRSFTRQL